MAFWEVNRKVPSFAAKTPRPQTYMTLEKFRKELYHLGISSQTFNSTLQLQLQQFNMDIENFSEDQFYEQEPLVIEIPENFFDNLIHLEEPGEFNEFELP